MIQTIKEMHNPKSLKDLVTFSQAELGILLRQIEDLEQKVTISNDLAALLTRYGYESPNLAFKAHNPCDACATNPKNGGNGVCYCTLGNNTKY